MPSKRPRRIHVETKVSGAFPAAYRPLLAKAARATAQAIPEPMWRAYLSGRTARLAVSIVGAAAIRKLNREFRQKDKPTDVLSFPTARVPGSDFAGDVIVCWQVAKKQTTEFSTTPRQEIQRLVVHGVLHLFGYDHELSRAEEKRMFRLQEKILKTL